MKKSTEIVIFFNPKNKNKGDSPVFVLAPPKKKTPLLEVSFALFGGAAGVSPTGHRKIQIFHFPNSNMLFVLFLMVDDDDSDDDDDGGKESSSPPKSTHKSPTSVVRKPRSNRRDRTAER